MTEIDEMPAGRELDALVAEKVMDQDFCRCPTDDAGETIHGICWKNDGFKTIQDVGTCWSCKKRPQHERYSTDIAAAWEVVEKLVLELGWDFDVSLEPAYADDAEQRVGVMFTRKAEIAAYAKLSEDSPIYVAGGLVPLAICRAALKAVEEK